MGFWPGFFRPKRAVTEFELLDENCTELVDAVGESHYQDALRAICGSKGWEDVAFDCIAVLVPEPTNPYDPNAVMVQVDGHCVGYLSRDNAIAYGTLIKHPNLKGRFAGCRAQIAGRAKARGGTTSNLGIFLRLPPADI